MGLGFINGGRSNGKEEGFKQKEGMSFNGTIVTGYKGNKGKEYAIKKL